MKIFKLSKISDLKEGSLIYGIYQCYYKDQKKTRYGDPFLNLSLSDKTGSINAKLWDNAFHYCEKFNEGDIVSIKAKADIYRSKLVLNILHIDRFSNDRYSCYGFNSDSLISNMDIDVKKMWLEISQYFSKTGRYNPLIKSIHKDFKSEFLTFPYNMTLPFQIESSYVFTIYKALNIADAILLNIANKELNSDILYSLIFLSQFSNLSSYEKDVIYRLKDEASKRGEENMFYDIFKKYKKTIPSKEYFLLEKSLFDSKAKDFNKEIEIVNSIFNLIVGVENEND